MAIKGSDIIEDNHLANAIQQSEKFLALQKQTNEELKKVAATMKDAFGKNAAKSAQDFQKISKGVKEITDIKTEQDKVNKQLTKSQEALVKAYSLENKSLQRNKLLTSERNKAVRDGIKADRSAVGSITALDLELNKLIKEYTGLSKVQRENQNVGGALQKRIQSLRGELDKLKRGTVTSKNSFGALRGDIQKATTTVKQFALAIGLVGGIRLFTNVIKGAVGIITKFDSAITNLGAISGFSADELTPLTNQAKELGATTRFTASNVAELQLELAKLGFSAKSISDLSEPVLNFASALGADLGEAAALTGATLRAFNLEASETARITDVLTAAATKSATDFAFFNTALSTVAPIANAVGQEIEDVAALLGTLANAGIDASTSATGLRNIFLALAESGQTLPEALDQILNSTDQASTALDLFGKRGASLGVVLANNQQATAELNEELLKAGGTAKEVADKQLNSLEGQLDLLKSAWEGFILGASDAGGISDKLKDIIGFLAQNLNVILKTTLAVIGAFVGFKILKGTISLIQGTATAFKGLNIIMRANPIGLIITAVGALITVFIFFRKEIGKTLDSVVKLFTSLEGIKNLFLAIFAPALLVAQAMDKQRDSVKKLTAEQIRNNKVNKEALKQGKEILKQNKEEIADVSVLIDALIDENTTREEKAEIIAKLNEDFPDLLENINLETASTEALIAVKKDLIKQILVQAIQVKKAEAQGALTGRIIELELQKIGSGKKGIAELDRQIKELTLSLPLIEEIARRVTDNLQKTVDSIDLSSSFREGNEEIRKLQKELVQLNKELTKAIANEDEERIEITKKRIKEITRRLQLAQGVRTTILNDALDKEKDINADGVKDFSKSEKKKTKILEDESAKREKILFDARTQLQKDLEENFKDNQRILAENAEKEKDRVAKINADQEKFAEQQRKKKKDKDKKDQEDEIKAKKEAAKTLIKIANDIAAATVKNIDANIEKQKNQITASEGRISSLKEAAAAGNLDAKESIKVEELRQQEAQIEIARLEKKKATLIAVTVGLKALGQAIDAGDQNAFANVGSKIASFIAGLSKFKSGTVDTGSGGGVDKDGGFLSVLHPHERVIPENLNKGLAGMSNEDLVANAMRWQDQIAMQNASRTVDAFGNIEVLMALNGIKDGQGELIKAVKANYPTSKTIDYDEVTKIVTETVISKNKKETRRKRIGGAFS